MGGSLDVVIRVGWMGEGLLIVVQAWWEIVTVFAYCDWRSSVIVDNVHEKSEVSSNEYV